VVSRWEKELEGEKSNELRRLMANRNATARETKPEEPEPVPTRTL
jgi:hypothetical protein